MPVVVGLDRFLAHGVRDLAGCRVGLATHSAAVGAGLTDAVGCLRQAGVHLVALFGPEHGLSGAVADGAVVADAVEPRSGLPIYSLYGATRQPSADALAGIDVLIFDMQDVGVRFYTFISTLYFVLESAAQARIPVTVLDRPNPIDGVTLEGPILEPDYTSFVGIAPIPVRYGLTIGELARFMNAAPGLGVELAVVPMEGWHRDMGFEDTGLLWVPTSPAMPHFSTAILYPGMCLLEGTNLSEGRGTALPFEVCGAPWVDGYALAARLNDLALPGIRFRPVQFVPAPGSRYGGVLCGGVQGHVFDRIACRPLTVGLQLIATVKALYPGDFSWQEQSWEGKRAHFDLLMGTGRARQALDVGMDVHALVQSWADGLGAFAATCQPYLLYV